jgi:hypothetical protein
LALLGFGQTEAALLFVVIMGTVGSVIYRDEHRCAIDSTDLYPRWTRVILPASLPFLLTGMNQGWAFACRSLMAAEVFVTILSGFGLGHLLHYGRELSAMDQVIGIMPVIVMIGLTSDESFIRAVRALHASALGRGRYTIGSYSRPLPRRRSTAPRDVAKFAAGIVWTLHASIDAQSITWQARTLRAGLRERRG